MKKVLVIIQAFVFFAFMVMPKPAHAAAPIAIAAGAEAGAGAYALILLGVAGVASGLGYVEYSEEIKQHALDTWNATNDAIKEAWNASVQAAAAAGTYIVEVPANVVEYFRGKQAEMISVGGL
ncbi:hypothetical protein [Brevibacillus brevis]|uniref:Holin n=1 Tax=Brevibacillus brevis TaxID=1393 RepID=A0ABY9TFW0_BREBE|nr:hypothetical protein [Brevibacillus brevis]WNC17863.1 hypothetical protein RGB73_30045 [Brevibacillus brevis]